MPQTIRQSLLQTLRKLGRKRTPHSARRVQQRRLICGERLEDRTLLATIVFNNQAGGDWANKTNWVGGQVPGTNDDVEIPVLSGTIPVYSSGPVSVKSLKISDDFVILGGNFSVATISHVAGIFVIDTNATANIAVAASFGNVSVSSGGTLNVAKNASVSVGTNCVLDASGDANFADGSSLTLTQNASNTFSQFILEARGTVTSG